MLVTSNPVSVSAETVELPDNIVTSVNLDSGLSPIAELANVTAMHQFVTKRRAPVLIVGI
jgi:hypothetical protein